MNPHKVKMTEEHEDHFVLHDGKSPFKVPKKGLSDALHEKIRAMAPKKLADGGDVMSLPDRRGGDVGAAEPIASYEPPQPAGPVYAPGLMSPGPAYVQPPSPEEAKLAELRSKPGFDEAAYQNATKGKFPTGGPAGFDETKRRAAEIDLEAGKQKAAADLGIRPPPKPDEKKPDEKSAGIPTPATAKTGGGGYTGPKVPGADTSEQDSAYGNMEAAERAKASVEAQGARNLAAAEGERQKQLVSNQLEQKAMLDRAHAESSAMLAKIQASSDDMAHQDMTVDPGRYWASRSTGQKIMGVIGLALGTLGAGPDGINRAAGMMNQAIDRDIDAQKSEHDLRLRKGQSAINAATSMYGLHHQTLQDDIAARAAAKATGDEIAASQLRQQLANNSDQAAQAQGALMLAKLDEDKAQNHAIAKERVFNDTLKANVEGSTAAKNWAEAARDRAAVGGAGVGLDQKTKDQLYQVETLHKVIQGSGEKLKALINSTGTMGGITGPGKKLMNQLASNIAVSQAKMNDPSSAARPGEVELELANLFQPGFWQDKDTALAAIDGYLGNSKQRRDVNYQTLGLKAP